MIVTNQVSQRNTAGQKRNEIFLFLGFQVLVLVGPKKIMSCVNKMFEVFF